MLYEDRCFNNGKTFNIGEKSYMIYSGNEKWIWSDSKTVRDILGGSEEEAFIFILLIRCIRKQFMLFLNFHPCLSI